MIIITPVASQQAGVAQLVERVIGNDEVHGSDSHHQLHKNPEIVMISGFFAGGSTLPIFSKGETKDKLVLLYSIKAIGLGITREQLLRTVTETDTMNYFDFSTSLGELEADGLIEARVNGFGQVYCLTEEGEQMLALFRDTLPYSLCNRLSDYAERNRDALKREQMLVSAMEEQPDGTYLVRLTVQTEHDPEMDISLHVISRAMAIRMRDAWQKRAEEVYTSLIGTLTGS